MNNIAHFIDEAGRIYLWPSKGKNKQAVLRYLTTKFATNRFYSEKEVNAIITEWHTFGDYFLLRRELVENRMMARTRNGARYWMTPELEAPYHEEVVKLLESNYDVGRVIAIVNANDGLGSDCYHVLTEVGEFILKGIESNGTNLPENVGETHCELSSDGTPMSELIPTKDGEYLVRDADTPHHLSTTRWFMSAVMKIS